MFSMAAFAQSRRVEYYEKYSMAVAKPRIFTILLFTEKPVDPSFRLSVLDLKKNPLADKNDKNL